MNKAKALELIAKFGKTPKDTGSPEVQVALLTERINYLSPHFAAHSHDYSSKRGMMKMIGKRRSLLKYLAANSPEKYTKVIKELGLRK